MSNRFNENGFGAMSALDRAFVDSTKVVPGTIYTTTVNDPNGWVVTAAPVRQPTLADHIEERMCRMQSDMDRLKQIKKQLSEPNGVLAVSVDDLQFAMRY